MVILEKDFSNATTNFERTLREKVSGYVVILNEWDDLTSNFYEEKKMNGKGKLESLFKLPAAINFEKLPLFYDENEETLVFKFKESSLLVVKESTILTMPSNRGMFIVIKAFFKTLIAKAKEEKKNRKLNKVKI